MRTLRADRTDMVDCFKKIFVLPLAALLTFAGGCNKSETIVYEPEQRISPEEDLSTLYPQIQYVYPGTLQTLDVPDPCPADIDPAAGAIMVIFSHVMENDSGELSSLMELYRNDVYVPAEITPAASSNWFIVTPATGGFQYGDTYDIYIYKFACPDDAPEYPLNFEPLVRLPASTLSPVNPAYVCYRFITADSPSADSEEPFLLSANPGNGDTGVETTLASTSGVIVLTFFDNSNPMIYPSTVNESTVTLVMMPGTTVPLSVTMETNDINFKTWYVRPLVPLENSATYILTVSAGASIEDFRGNHMIEDVQIFSTEP